MQSFSTHHTACTTQLIGAVQIGSLSTIVAATQGPSNTVPAAPYPPMSPHVPLASSKLSHNVNHQQKNPTAQQHVQLYKHPPYHPNTTASLIEAPDRPQQMYIEQHPPTCTPEGARCHTYIQQCTHIQIETPGDTSLANRQTRAPATPNSTQSSTLEPTETKHGQACRHAGPVHVHGGLYCQYCHCVLPVCTATAHLPHTGKANCRWAARGSSQPQAPMMNPVSRWARLSAAEPDRQPLGYTMAAHPAGTVGAQWGSPPQTTQHTLQCAAIQVLWGRCRASRRQAAAHNPVQ
jgi:hypothetical protein